MCWFVITCFAFLILGVWLLLFGFWVAGFRVCCFRLNSVAYLVYVAMLFIICRCILVVRLLAIVGCFVFVGYCWCA